MYLLLFLAGVFAFTLLIFVVTAPIREKNMEKRVRDDNAKEEIRGIVNRLIPGGEELSVVSAISTESAGSMIKDGVIDVIVSIILGALFRRYKTTLPDEYICAFGKKDLYFIPVTSNFKTKKIIGRTNKIAHFDTNTVLKVQYNPSKFKTTIVVPGENGKFTFSVPKNCFFTKLQEEERNKYDSFIRIFSEQVGL